MQYFNYKRSFHLIRSFCVFSPYLAHPQKMIFFGMSDNEIPEAIWARWSRPEFEPFRQVVLSFGGNMRTEALIDSFPDVALLVPDGDNMAIFKGVFYLTTKRMAFLPRNMIHPNMVQASFDSLRCITGTRNDLTALVVDVKGSMARFQFTSAHTLYQCFNLFRQLAEASRLPEDKFRNTIYAIATATRRNDTPFNSIEVELQECTQTPEVPVMHDIEVVEEAPDPVTVFLAPVKSFFDYFNNLHFDIRVRLRILLTMSIISFFLQRMPFLPFVAILTILFLLYNAWGSINRDLEDEENQEPIIPPVAAGFVVTEKFLMEYLGWRDPRKSMRVLQTSVAIVLAWLVLPSKLYPLVCLAAYIYYVIMPLKDSNFVTKIFSVPWLST